MLFYLMHAPSGRFRVSPFPKWDKLYLQQRNGGRVSARVLTPGIPLAYLEPLLRRQSRNIESLPVKKAEDLFLKLLGKEDSLKEMPWHWQDLEPAENQIESELVPINREVMEELIGRQLTEDELGKLAAAHGLKPEEVWQQAHFLVCAGQGEWAAAVHQGSKGWECQRCGESELEEWPGLYGESFTCPSCRSLGTCSSLKTMYRDLRNHKSEPLDFCLEEIPRFAKAADADVRFGENLKLGLVFTPAQEQAAKDVLEFVRSHQEHEALLWAACGAGKTEVCFPATAWALGQGQNVLFAAPRQDVIRDVAPRLQQAFPGLSIPVLSGVSASVFGSGPLVLATTHQVLRFYRFFDLIFLDELDAFPYYNNRMLQWGMIQAMRPGGKILFLSATPDRAILKRLGQRKRIIRLPARHHRRPLPVPKWIKSNDWNNIDSCIAKMQTNLKNALERLHRQGPVIFFVPKISWVKAWTEALKSLFPAWNISGSYSRDPERVEKLGRLRQGEFDLFVATSILERGVTIEAAQVAVMAADHSVFDERALVQMAGRAGRTQTNPEGEVIFLAMRETESMRTAIHWITEQNALARSAGLLN